MYLNLNDTRILAYRIYDDLDMSGMNNISVQRHLEEDQKCYLLASMYTHFLALNKD